MEKKLNTVRINVDGKEVEVPAGINLVEAVAVAGKEIPHYCYHPKLSVAGNCRMCLVEVGTPVVDRATGQAVLEADGKAKIGWMPKPAIGCGTKVSEGMHVKTESAVVKDCQQGVMEMLLVNHPLDCPICDQAGECRLQEFAMDYGRGSSRYIEEKNVKPKQVAIGPRVTLDDERCILCSRCVRFCKEVIKEDVLGFIDHGSHTTLTCYPGKQLESNYSLNTVDICPVGALTSTDFRFKMRVWFLKRTKSICTESSVGVNTEVWSREGKIYRITPRRNDEVNDTWMADSGRELYKLVESEGRIKEYRVNGKVVMAEEAYRSAGELMRQGGMGCIGSSFMSVEEQYLLKRIVDRSKAEVGWVSHVKKGDGLLISEDRTPNMRGALVVGLIGEVPGEKMEGMVELIERGEVGTLLVINEDLTRYGVTEETLRGMKVVYMGTHENGTSRSAAVVIPGQMVFERRGSFINEQFRLQRFEQAVAGPVGTLPDLYSLIKLYEHYTGEVVKEETLEKVWEAIRGEIEELKEVTWGRMGDGGYLLKAERFKGMNFVEKGSLHYKPEMLVGV